MTTKPRTIRLNDKIFAFYKEGEYICEGTIEELIEITGYPIRTLNWMASGAANVRGRHTVLVEIIDLDIFLKSLSLNASIIKKLAAYDIHTADDLIKHSPEFLSWVIKNKQQVKTVHSYYDYFKKEVEDNEADFSECTKHTA